MPDTFIPLAAVQFVEQLVCERYRVKIPKFLAEAHEWWDSWEKERFASIQENLREGDILFDVGAETGWISAIYAQFVARTTCACLNLVPKCGPQSRRLGKRMR